MKKISIYFLLLITTFISCTKEFNDQPIDNEVNSFVWRGLNNYYLWQKDVPNLSDRLYLNQGNLFELFKQYPNPTEFFNALRVDNATDRFSVIYDDYVKLEQALSGTENSNGVDFEIRRKVPGSNELFGFVRYILPNSDASTKNIQRGDIFYAINGTALTIDNYRQLLSLNSYTLNMATYSTTAITSNGVSVSLTKTNYSENPVFYTNVYNIGTKKIGYLVYNGFYSQYDTQLNAAIGNLKTQGITHLILDLRYNPGGSVNTSTRLASMITGQFNGQVFAKQIWNNKIANANDPESFINRFSNNTSIGTLNNLNLTKLYVITTKSTASASELLINGLKPYINLIQIGATTTGKNVGSVTLYDSPNFAKSKLNPSHKYAMQPITFKTANKNNFGDYGGGLVPDVVLAENLSNLGIIGNTSEPLLQAALNYVDTNGRININQKKNATTTEFISDTKQLKNSNVFLHLELPNIKLPVSEN